MASPGDDPRYPAAIKPAKLRQFLLYLGSGLTAAGEAVNEIQVRLEAVAAAYGAPQARIAVLPTFTVVALDPMRPATLEPTGQLRGVLRLHQTSALYDILKRAERAEVRPADGTREILGVLAMPLARQVPDPPGACGARRRDLHDPAADPGRPGPGGDPRWAGRRAQAGRREVAARRCSRPWRPR